MEEAEAFLARSIAEKCKVLPCELVYVSVDITRKPPTKYDRASLAACSLVIERHRSVQTESGPLSTQPKKTSGKKIEGKDQIHMSSDEF